MSGVGTTELLIIAIILVFLFGGKKIPELIKGVSEAIMEFRKSSKEPKEEKEKEE